MTITENTLLHAFPHLLDNDHHDVGRSLASRMLDWRFSVRGSVRFEWDDATNRVKRLTCQSDMMTPMLKFVGSVEDMARVFDQARLTLDDNIGGEISSKTRWTVA